MSLNERKLNIINNMDVCAEYFRNILYIFVPWPWVNIDGASSEDNKWAFQAYIFQIDIDVHFGISARIVYTKAENNMRQVIW